MSRRLFTILFLAFVTASACSYLAWRTVGDRLDASRLAAGTRVVAAAEDIKLGAILTADDLKVISIAGGVPKGAILEKDKSRVIGRGVVSNLNQGEPIVESRLAVPGSGGGLAATIPSGMRACAIKVDDVVGVGGFVTPGMRVDVLISGTPPAPGTPSQGTEARTILQNIEVLSAGTDIQKDGEGKPKQAQVVNLLVDPKQAETLSLASNQQVRVLLVLRNPLDTEVAEVPGAAMASLFGDSVPPRPIVRPAAAKIARPTAPRTISIVVMNGSKRTEEQFASPEVRQ
ncbi:MAG: Flp pilus assembly protein CpaB [Terracidiphilus sp.]|jgi:pilus assembly protein CpaB